MQIDTVIVGEEGLSRVQHAEIDAGDNTCDIKHFVFTQVIDTGAITARSKMITKQADAQTQFDAQVAAAGGVYVAP